MYAIGINKGKREVKKIKGTCMRDFMSETWSMRAFNEEVYLVTDLKALMQNPKEIVKQIRKHGTLLV